MNYLNIEDNEIICQAYAVKYHDINYSDNYITITQNRTKRRVPKGYYFEDTGSHIYVSSFYADIFQHKHKRRSFLLNKETKEWRDYVTIIAEKHIPDKKTPIKNEITTLKRSE